MITFANTKQNTVKDIDISTLRTQKIAMVKNNTTNKKLATEINKLQLELSKKQDKT